MSTTEQLIELEERMWRANREGDGSFYADVLRDLDASLESLPVG